MRTNLLSIALMSFFAFSANAKPTIQQQHPAPKPKPAITKILPAHPLAPSLAAKIKPAKPHTKRIHIAKPHHSNNYVTPVPPPPIEKCSILKTSDPEDNIAFILWSAYVASPRHATRAAWEKFENQPIFFRMALATMAMCAGQPVTLNIAIPDPPTR